MTIKTFAPGAATVNLSATTASANIAINQNANAARVYNDGPDMVFIHFGGDNTITAGSTVSMPIPAGTIETFTKGSASYLAAVSVGTSKVYITVGEGL